MSDVNSPKYNEFITSCNQTIKQVEDLPDQIKSQWGNNTLSMAYHYDKHGVDFVTNKDHNVTVENYFNQFASDIFDQRHLTGTGFTQSGVPRASYARRFGQRTHVGFTTGSNRVSHYAPVN